MPRAAPLAARMLLARAAGPLAGIAFALLLAGTAHALDRRVRIVNDSHVDIADFYAVNVDAREWSESLIGDDILPAGASVVLNLDDGSGYCRYRFRAVFVDGFELERPSVNVCEVGTYRYTD